MKSDNNSAIQAQAHSSAKSDLLLEDKNHPDLKSQDRFLYLLAKLSAALFITNLLFAIEIRGTHYILIAISVLLVMSGFAMFMYSVIMSSIHAVKYCFSPSKRAIEIQNGKNIKTHPFSDVHSVEITSEGGLLISFEKGSLPLPNHLFSLSSYIVKTKGQQIADMIGVELIQGRAGAVESTEPKTKIEPRPPEFTKQQKVHMMQGFLVAVGGFILVALADSLFQKILLLKLVTYNILGIGIMYGIIRFFRAVPYAILSEKLKK